MNIRSFLGQMLKIYILMNIFFLNKSIDIAGGKKSTAEMENNDYLSLLCSERFGQDLAF